MLENEQDELDSWQEIMLDNRARVNRENAERAKERADERLRHWVKGILWLGLVIIILGIYVWLAQ